MAAGQLGGQLYPTHSIADPQQEQEINLSFGTAIQEWNKHNYREAVGLFKAHISQYPNSPWVAEAQLHMGCDAQYTGRYSEADALFSSIIAAYAASDTSGAKQMVNKALLRRGVLKTFQNNLPEAERLFATLLQKSDNWRDRTYASHWIQRIAAYNADKLALLNCGTLALARVLEKDGNIQAARDVRDLLPQSLSGQSLRELKEIASLYGYRFAGLHISPDDLAKMPLPAIVQLPGQNPGDSGHYWVLEKIGNGTLELFDAQAGRMFTQSITEFTREWRGDILVFQDRNVSLASLGRELSDNELNEIFGGCCGVPAPPSNTGNPGINSPVRSSCPNNACGTPAWSVNMVSMNLYVHDVPLWFSSPIGPSVEISLSYNSQSSITLHEPFGNKWQFNYASYLVVDTGGQVTIFMPDGRHDIYSPNGSGGYNRPSGIFNTLNKLAENHFTLVFRGGTVYEYNIPAGTASLQPFLVKISDPYGRSLTFGYDAQVRLITITDALNRVTSLDYNASGLVTKVTDPFGRFASFEYDGTKLARITDMGGYASTLTYDQNVYLTSIGNSRGTWQFYIEPADGINNGSNPFPPPGGAMWQNARITITDPDGKSELYAHNGYSNYGWYVSPNYYVPYSSGSDNSYVSPTAKKQIYNFTKVNGWGQISLVTNPDGSKESYGYDGATGLRNRITDPQGHVTTLQFNAQGLPVSVTNPKTITTSLSYAGNGVDLTGVTNGLGTIAMTYDAFHKVTSLTNRRGKKTSFTYDTFGKISSMTDPLGNVTNFAYYDASSPSRYLLKEITRNGKLLAGLGYDAIGRVLSRTDATGLTLLYTYNNLNHLTAVTWPDGKQETYTYAGCCPRLIDSYTDRTGRTTTYAYDAEQRLTEARNPDGTLIRYAYDNNGNLIRLTDGNGNATVFAYDTMNRRVKRSYADGREETYTYDSDGLLVGRTGGRGIRTSYTYDVNHNLANVFYSDGTPTIGYVYDDFDRLTARTDAVGTTGYTFDADLQLTTLDGPWGDDTITYTYDDSGRLTAVQQQAAETISYAYDVFDRLTGIGVGTRQFTYGYPATGASPIPLTLTRPNGSFTAYQNDVLNRLTSLVTKKSSQQLVASNTFTYSAQDQRDTEAVENGPANPALTDNLVTYDYNRVNQILSSTNPNRTYAYDADGNMTSGFTPEGYQFTATYDGENRLKTFDYTDSASVPHHSVFTYNGDNFLAKQSSDGVETRFVRSGYTLLHERSAANSITRASVWDPRAPGGIGGLIELNQVGERYYPFYDGKGNVKGVLDAGQNTVAGYSYDPFGLPFAKSGTFDQPFRFSTKRYDEKTGLSYFGYRFYSPVLGRWLNRDPLGEIGGINIYEYVRNNPINYTDPLGLRTFDLPLFGEVELEVPHRFPDFYSINLSFGLAVGLSFSASLDRYGNVFYSYKGWNVGKSASPSLVTGSFLANWVTQECMPNEVQLTNLQSGESYNLTLGGILLGGLGASITHSSRLNNAFGFGVVLPVQIGGSWNESQQVPIPKLPFPFAWDD